MKKIIIILMTVLLTENPVILLASPSECTTSVEADSKPSVEKKDEQSAIDDLLQKGYKSYHMNKLKTFAYCAANRPSADEVHRASIKLRFGSPTSHDFEIVSREDFCKYHENDWTSDNYWSLHYHVRELGKELGWEPEKIVREQAAYLAKLVNLKKTRQSITKM